MFDLISVKPEHMIVEITKYFIGHDERKSVALVITKPNALIFLWYDVLLFPPSLSIYLLSLLIYVQAKLKYLGLLG